MTRNYLFISDEVQRKLSECRVLIIGSGLGSVIAESLLRIGVQNLCVCDGDVVSESNLNRQNYTNACVSKSKAEALSLRLLAIHPNLNIETVDHFLNASDMEEMIPRFDFIINTIDFDSPAYIACHELCRKFGKLEFLPINLGFGFGLFVFKDIFFNENFSKETILDYIVSGQRESQYMKDKLAEYSQVKRDYDPQLIVGALGNAAMICTVICKQLNNEKIKSFPLFYFCDFKSF